MFELSNILMGLSDFAYRPSWVEQGARCLAWMLPLGLKAFELSCMDALFEPKAGTFREARLSVSACSRRDCRVESILCFEYRGMQAFSIGRRVESMASLHSLTQKKLSFALLRCSEINFDWRVTGFLFYRTQTEHIMKCFAGSAKWGEMSRSSSTPPSALLGLL